MYNRVYSKDTPVGGIGRKEEKKTLTHKSDVLCNKQTKKRRCDERKKEEEEKQAIC